MMLGLNHHFLRISYAVTEYLAPFSCAAENAGLSNRNHRWGISPWETSWWGICEPRSTGARYSTFDKAPVAALVPWRFHPCISCVWRFNAGISVISGQWNTGFDITSQGSRRIAPQTRKREVKGNAIRNWLYGILEYEKVLNIDAALVRVMRLQWGSHWLDSSFFVQLPMVHSVQLTLWSKLHQWKFYSPGA